MIPVPTPVVLALLRGDLAPSIREALELAALDAAEAASPPEPIPYSAPDGREPVAFVADWAGIRPGRVHGWIAAGRLDYVLRESRTVTGPRMVRAVRLDDVIRLRDGGAS